WAAGARRGGERAPGAGMLKHARRHCMRKRARRTGVCRVPSQDRSHCMVSRLFVMAAAASFFLAGCAAPPRGEDEALRQAVGNPARTPAFVARDAARKPYEVLRFFDIRPDATVVEISPGGGYWTEILAPYLRERGVYYAAQYPREGSTRPYHREYYDR